VADLHEACWKDVLEESPDELHGVECHGPPTVAFGLTVAEEHLVVLDLDDSGVGNGNPEDVGGEVLEGGSGFSHGLGMDIPVDLPDQGVDFFQQPRYADLIPELSPEESGECPDGEKEIGSRGMPGVILCGEGSPGGDVVDVGMVLELATPGVKDAPEAGEIGSYELLVGGQGFQCLGRCLEHGLVAKALVGPDEGAELLWDREGDQEVWSWQLAFHLSMEPKLSFVVLAGGAVAVAARAEDEMGLMTLGTVVEHGAVGFTLAVDDGLGDLEMVIRDGIPEPEEVVGSIDSEDIVDSAHG